MGIVIIARRGGEWILGARELVLSGDVIVVGFPISTFHLLTEVLCKLNSKPIRRILSPLHFPPFRTRVN